MTHQLPKLETLYFVLIFLVYVFREIFLSFLFFFFCVVLSSFDLYLFCAWCLYVLFIFVPRPILWILKNFAVS